MSFSSDMARLVADQLARFVTLNRHQLAGQAAILDFWLAEVRHGLEVIDGYGARFDRLKAAQSHYTSEHQTIEFRLSHPKHTRRLATPPRRVPDTELSEARRCLSDAAYRFLMRCYHEGFIEEFALREACDRLDIGIEPSDLKTGAP